MSPLDVDLVILPQLHFGVVVREVYGDLAAVPVQTPLPAAGNPGAQFNRKILASVLA